MRHSIPAVGMAATLVTGASAVAVSNATTPCGKVSSAYKSQVNAGSESPFVSAELAYDCLQSVPLGKEEALDLVDAIEPYLEWQSDAAYKANPPADYYYPAFDIFDNLDKVRSNLKADEYENEYAFQTDLYLSVFGMGHDGHFVMYPDLLSRAFGFYRQLALVSVSEDAAGSLPVIKIYEDVVNNPETASAVTKINGIEASQYVLEVAASASYNQDIDAAYNGMFYEKATYASSGYKGSFAEGGRVNLVYRGPTTTFTFANGTEVTTENRALIKGDFTNVVDGKSFYSKFCSPQTTQSSSGESAKLTKPPGYPDPVITTSDAIVSGYYLDGEGVEDVAVLALLAMESASIKEFQAVIQDFLREAKADGKTKLVVDFQANGGGYILLGYDFFRQLFPDIIQDGNSRWKENSGFMAMSHTVSTATKDFDPYTSDDADLISLYETWFNYRYDLDTTNEDFPTFAAKFAPQIYENTPYTSLMRWNLSDPLTTTNATYGMGIEISGYGSLSNNISQPFAPEDIVLLYDGICASTCTISSEMLRIQGGVKSVAMGGRPQRGPIQGVGGVKGSQILNFADIYTYAGIASNYTDDEELLKTLAQYDTLPFQRATAAAANVRDQILNDGEEEGLPAQFVVEEADCRLYWTEEMVGDVGKVWEAAAKAAFYGQECAYGSIVGGGGEYPATEYPTARGKNVAGVKPNKRAFPTVAAPFFERFSEKVDKTPDVHSEEWLAVHRQKAIF